MKKDYSVNELMEYLYSNYSSQSPEKYAAIILSRQALDIQNLKKIDFIGKLEQKDLKKPF